MLSYENTFAARSPVAIRAQNLFHAPAGASGRPMRRFLEELCDDIRPGEPHLVLAFAQFNSGYNLEQLLALRGVAQRVLDESGEALADWPVEPGFMVYDEEMGVLSLCFKLKVGLSPAARLEMGSVADFRGLLRVVLWLLDKAEDLLQPGWQAGLAECPDYLYRGLPCSVVSHDRLWVVSGSDSRGGSGVLEWCVSEEDANEVLAQMRKQPNRFTSLSADAWQSLTELAESASA